MKLNLLLNSSITNQNETQDKLKVSLSGLDTEGHYSGGGTLAAGSSKSIFTGSSTFVSIKSSKAVEITINGTTVIPVHPLKQDYNFVDAVFSCSLYATSISIKNISLEEADYSFLITE